MLGAVSRPNPAPGGLGKGPGRGPVRFSPVSSPVDKFEGHSVSLLNPFVIELEVDLDPEWPEPRHQAHPHGSIP